MNKWLWSAKEIQRVKSKRNKPRNITSKGNQQDQDVGLILIMSGYKKISVHVKQISIKNCMKTFRSDDTKTYQIFGLPIGNAKTSRKVQFHQAAPVIKCHQKSSSSCCLSSLASAFHCINDNRAVSYLVNSID